VIKQLKDIGIRVQGDMRSEKIGFKIREARLEKIPYLLVVGEKEAESGEVSVWSRSNGDEGGRPLADFVRRVRTEIDEKKIY
jgi:threonyl-tRNA synthetase